jgi:hypothetical protein
VCDFIIDAPGQVSQLKDEIRELRDNHKRGAEKARELPRSLVEQIDRLRKKQDESLAEDGANHLPEQIKHADTVAAIRNGHDRRMAELEAELAARRDADERLREEENRRAANRMEKEFYGQPFDLIVSHLNSAQDVRIPGGPLIRDARNHLFLGTHKADEGSPHRFARFGFLIPVKELPENDVCRFLALARLCAEFLPLLVGCPSAGLIAFLLSCCPQDEDVYSSMRPLGKP